MGTAGFSCAALRRRAVRRSASTPLEFISYPYCYSLVALTLRGCQRSATRYQLERGHDGDRDSCRDTARGNLGRFHRHLLRALCRLPPARERQFFIPLVIVTVLTGAIFYLNSGALQPMFDAEFDRAMAAAMRNNPNIPPEAVERMRGFASRVGLIGVFVFVPIAMLWRGICHVAGGQTG